MANKAIPKPRTSDRRIWDAVYGVYGYAGVFVAHKLGLFRLLRERSRDLEEICRELKIERRPAETLMAILTSLGFARLKKGAYSLTTISEDYLVEDSPTYCGHYLDLIINNYSVCSVESLEKAVRSNSPQVYGGGDTFKSHEEQAELARAFTRAMHSVSIAPAMVWPSAIDLSKHRLILDVAGGSGAHSIGATLRFPKLKAIVFDMAPVCEVAAEFVAQRGLQNRISTCVGDMWSDPFPSADVHFYSNIYHDWPDERCEFLTRRSFESLPSGGRLILHEALYNNAKTGPFPTAAFSMVMLGWTNGGEQRSGAELSKMLTHAGFKDLRTKPSFGYMSIVTGRKP